MGKSLGVVEFLVPIQEAKRVTANAEGFMIRGVAINATTTRNGTRFLAEELRLSAQSLRNKPILKDHNNSVDSIVGKTTENVNFDEGMQAVVFEGVVFDEDMQRKIDLGLVKNVSIGAMVSDWEEVKDEHGNTEAVVVKGIDFVELSLVAVPADPGAGFAKAIAEKLQASKQATPITISSSGSFTIATGTANTSPTKTYTVTSGSSTTSTPETTKQEELLMAEEQTSIENLRAERAKLEEEKLRLENEIEAQKVEQLKQQKEALASATKTATIVEDKTKGEVAEDAEQKTEDSSPYVLEQTELGFGVTAPYSEKLKRLNR